MKYYLIVLPLISLISSYRSYSQDEKGPYSNYKDILNYRIAFSDFDLCLEHDSPAPSFLTMKTLTKGSLTPTDLTCEYLSDPLSSQYLTVDTQFPRLSWKLVDPRRCSRQTAYQILVASSERDIESGKATLWNSGKMKSPETVGIRYEGRKLKSGDRCWWKVRIWDQDGKVSEWSRPAHWTIGLLDLKDWKAKWISPPPVEPVITAHFGYRSNVAKSEFDPKWVQIDLGKSQEIDAVRLWGAWPQSIRSKSRPKGDGFPVRFKVEVSNNQDCSDARIVVDRTGADVPNPGIEPVLQMFEPVAARYVRFTATKLSGDWTAVWDPITEHYTPKPTGKGWALALAEMEVLRKERNIALGQFVTSGDSINDGVTLKPPESGGWSAARLTDGQTEADAGTEYHHQPVTLFRHEFLVARRVLFATLHVTAKGCYEVHVNGIRVGDDELAPGMTVRNQRVVYQTYDVSRLILPGENAIGAMLADGWHRSRTNEDYFNSKKRFASNSRKAFLAQLELEYEDGTRETIVTDNSWLCNNNGPMQLASMYDGVLYDARKEIPGWDKPGLPDIEGWRNPVDQPIDSFQLLSAQSRPPIRVLYELKPVSRTEPRSGIYVFDFGKEMAGVCRLTLDGPEGTMIKLRHAEAVLPDGRLFLGNLQGNYNNHDTFILSGQGPQTFQAKFTYHGFRYVEVSGLPSTNSNLEITALALGSDIRQTAIVTCSDNKLNQLCAIIEQAYRSNMPGLMVDVAGRDERLPFLGDCFTVQSLSYLYDFAAFGSNENRAIVDDLDPDGIAPGWLQGLRSWQPDPTIGATAEPGWSDGSVITPLTLWVNYADRRTLELSYDGVKRFMNAIERENPDYVPKKKYVSFWGDWMCPQTKRTLPGSRPGAPRDLFTAAWWAYSAENVSKIAMALGKDDESKRYAGMASRIRAAFVKNHLNPDGTLTGDEQSCYALALGMNLVSGMLHQQALEKLLQSIHDNDDHLSTGSITTIFLLKNLAENDQNGLAYRLVMQPTSPSYGSMIEGGATSMWEQFANQDLNKGSKIGFGGLNHLGLNSVYEWIFGYVAGIRPDPASLVTNDFLSTRNPVEM